MRLHCDLYGPTMFRHPAYYTRYRIILRLCSLNTVQYTMDSIKYKISICKFDNYVYVTPANFYRFYPQFVLIKNEDCIAKRTSVNNVANRIWFSFTVILNTLLFALLDLNFSSRLSSLDDD